MVLAILLIAGKLAISGNFIAGNLPVFITELNGNRLFFTSKEIGELSINRGNCH